MAQPLTVTTIAGQYGVERYGDGVGTNAQFLAPDGISADLAGNLYVVDFNGIRKISPDLTVTTFAGNPKRFGYYDATGMNALFGTPTGIAVDKNGYIYVADSDNYVIRKISPSGVVATLAGNGSFGYLDVTGTNAEFANLGGIAVDSSGNVYVSDFNYYDLQVGIGTRIRKITADGVVSTLAGGSPGYNDGKGVNAQFYFPRGLAVDAGGHVYVADGFGIRKVSPDGTVTTWAGSQNNNGTELDGLASNAGFYGARAIALDRAGGAYVVDENGFTIRFVSSGGVVSTVAGLAGTPTYSSNPPVFSNDGVGSGARFADPDGITVDPAGNVYIADAGGSTVLKGVPPSLPPIGFFSVSPGVAPIRSSNPWTFTATYSTLVSDLRLRVQSTLTTNSEASWTDLPGNPYMTHVDANWTLDITDVPTGDQYFRAIASAPGYIDGLSLFNGPWRVLEGIAPLTNFTWQTIPPYRSGEPWTFSIGETSTVPGLGLRVQSTTTTNIESSWTDLTGGQMSTSDSLTWTLTTWSLPVGTVYFRVIASAATYPDRISTDIGPFTTGQGLGDFAPGDFQVLETGTPYRSSNPWTFEAHFTNLVSGLRLRVQSTTTTNSESSWTDLPGNPYMTMVDYNWTLNTTDIPDGIESFRVVASAPGYVDSTAVAGPLDVLPGMAPFYNFAWHTTWPLQTPAPWVFTIDEASVIDGLGLRVQSSLTPDVELSWTDLPGGQMFHEPTNAVT